MRLSAIIMILGLSIFKCAESVAQEADPEKAKEIALTAIEALKTGRFDHLDRCCMASDKDLKKIAKKTFYFENQGMANPDMAELRQQLVLKLERQFNMIRKVTEKAGIDFSNIVFDNVIPQADEFKMDLYIFFDHENEPCTLIVENMQSNGSEYRLAFNTEIKMANYEPHELLAKSLFKALAKRDVELFFKESLPNNADLKDLYDAVNKDEPDYLADDDMSQLLVKTKDNLRKDFDMLLQKGTEMGLHWSHAKLSFVGQASELKGGFYELDVPFQFRDHGNDYRVVVKKCMQLADNRIVILPGRLIWEGKQN